MLNKPFESAITDLLVALTVIVAPESGSPDADLSVPLITSWACILKVSSKATAVLMINLNSRFFCFILCSF